MEENVKSKAEQLYKIAKKVPYSTKVYGEKEGEINPKIMLKILKPEDNKVSDRTTLLTLKYESLKGIPIEVVIATVSGTEDRKSKIEKMVELIENQLRDNANGVEGYNYYKEMMDYKKTANVPIKLTLEGLEILSTKNKEEIKIDKTYCINEDEKFEKLFTDEEIEQKKKLKNPKVLKYQLWQEGRELILKKFRTEKSKEAFLKGEKIAKIMEGMEIEEGDTKEEIEVKEKNKRKFVADYLLDVYDEKVNSKQDIDGQSEYQKIEDNVQELREKVENTIKSKSIDERMRAKLEILKKQLDSINNKSIVDEQKDDQQTDDEQSMNDQELLSKYLKIKEKGLTIDINIFLENLQNTLMMQIQKKIDEKEIKDTSPKDFRQIKLLQAYHSFFDIVKNGMDRTSRIYALKTENLNFETLEKVFEKYDKQEIIQYIKLKDKVLQETKTDDITNREKEYPSIRELDEFLLNSSVREMTKEDDEEIFSKIFEKAKRYVLENNAQEVDLYNYWAKSLNMYECPTNKKEDAEKSSYPTNSWNHDDGNR